MKDKPFREICGDLIWLTRVHRYDMIYAVNACSRVANNPGPVHWEALCKILRYLNHTKDFGLEYHQDGTGGIRGFSDSDWAPNYGNYFDNYRSTSGEIITANDHAVLWRSRRQHLVAQASCEAEYYAAADASKDLIFVDRIMHSLSADKTNHPPPILYVDNKSAIAVAQNAQDNEKQRHIDMRAHFLRDCVSRFDIELKFIPGAENPADNQTKPLGDTKFGVFRKRHHLVSNKMHGEFMKSPQVVG